MVMLNIEGLDGVGKNSITRELESLLTKFGYKVKVFSFPNYNETLGKTIKEVLYSKWANASTMNPYLLGPLYTLDRIKTFKEFGIENLEEYDFVICDRSYYSNFIYQASKFKTAGEIAEWLNLNYQLEILGVLDKFEKYTYVLMLSEEDRMEQIKNRDREKDDNESNDKYMHNVYAFTKFVTSKPGAFGEDVALDVCVRTCKYKNEITKDYFERVFPIEVLHAGPEDAEYTDLCIRANALAVCRDYAKRVNDKSMLSLIRKQALILEEALYLVDRERCSYETN